MLFVSYITVRAATLENALWQIYISARFNTNNIIVYNKSGMSGC
jgi:hypothetical protein